MTHELKDKTTHDMLREVVENQKLLLPEIHDMKETTNQLADNMEYLKSGNQDIHGALQSIKRATRRDDGAIGRVMVGGWSGWLLATVASCGTGATIAGVLGGAAIGGAFKDAVEVCKNYIQYSSV